jgi:NAD(P)H-dependent FMN reductase
MMITPKILCFSGSTRSGSINVRLLDSAVKELSVLDCEVTRISLEDYPLPIYNGDLEEKEGVPENAVKLAKLMSEHDGYFVTCPEYNGSLTPLMKNTIDWMTRVPAEQAVPFKDKVGAIAACSPGGMGGIAMLYHLREILVRLGSLIISEQVAVGNGFDAFDDHDKLKDKRSSQFLTASCKSLATKAALLKV